MDATRLHQIEEIYHAAVGSDPGIRAAFVKARCCDDEPLRLEIESLLSFDEIADSFIDGSPDAIAAEMFSDENIKVGLIGKTIGHYHIKNLLGVGGMGEVYLADDSLLNRSVALKILPQEMVEHHDRLKRFKQEAQASSALNHPNILTIHGFGNEDGSNYIVTEFVDGPTLRQRVAKGALSITETLDIAIQIASALAAAHEAGIVHRDIKPENIMIRRDGIVKVLDFGLAKLTMPTGAEADSGNEANTLFKTEPGMVMGTVAYMSPEQARGVKIDGRTDIWSLGVIIYEMATAHLPFSGETQTDTLVAILNKPTPMLEDFVKEAPTELNRIIDKALAKIADARYQAIEDLAADLKAFKSRLEFEAEMERSQGAQVTNDGKLENTTRIMPAVTDEEQSLADPDRRPASRKSRPLVITIAALLVFAVLAFGGAVAFVWYLQKQQVASSTQSVIDTKPVRALTYSLTVQKYEDGRYKDPFKLSGEMLFGNKDRVRLNVKSPQTGYLYILNQGLRRRAENTHTTYCSRRRRQATAPLCWRWIRRYRYLSKAGSSSMQKRGPRWFGSFGLPRSCRIWNPQRPLPIHRTRAGSRIRY